MSESVPTIRILLERTEGGWQATAFDEVGQVGGPVVRSLRIEAEKRCRIQAARLMGVACRFVVQELGEGR